MSSPLLLDAVTHARFELFVCAPDPGDFVWFQIAAPASRHPYLAGTTNAAGKLKAPSKAELGAIYKEYANPTTYKASLGDITTGGSERPRRSLC